MESRLLPDQLFKISSPLQGKIAVGGINALFSEFLAEIGD
jgi:hypothetical protein